MAAASNGSEYFEFDVETGRESFARPSNADTVEQDEEDLRWAAIGRLPSQRHGGSNLGTTILRRSQTQSQTTSGYADGNVVQTIDVKKLDRADREMLVRQALATSDQDNYKLLSAIKERLDRAGMEVPKIEVRFENLNIEADVQAGIRALPTLVNVSRDFVERCLSSLMIIKPKKHKLNILKDISGIIKPGRMTLLLGPPGSGKSTLLLALAGKLDKSLKKTGNITYNGENLDEFHVKRTSAYISQTDNHIAELTVRETLDFAARCQGANEGFAGYMKDLTRLEKERGIRPSSEIDAFMKKTGNITYNGENLDEFHVKRTSAYISQTDNHIAELTVRETLDFAARCQGANEGFAGYMKDLTRLEKERGIRPSSEIDAFMKAASVKGEKHSVSTDYVLRVLGLDVCSDTIVGNDMMRGVSGGQRKRVTTGEMTVGPRKTLFMDEISTGLDSSTTFQIVKCIRNFVHLMDATVLMALLQPAPETFDLFDDLILLSEGYMVYQGPRQDVVGFFESLGFRLPPRKGVADFLQEVTSKKDQAQYWADPSKPYQFIPVSDIAAAFRNSQYGHAADSKLATPFDKSSADPSALCRTKFAISGWENLKACFEREILLINRHRFLYTFRTCQVAFVGFVTATVFLRTRLHPTNEQFGNEYLSCLFFGLVHMMFNGFSELPLMISRLPVFYKQRDNSFHPAWSWSIASWLLRVPYSILEAVVWTCVVYYSVGLAPSPGRFFRYMLLLFSVHQMALGLFRMMASLARDMVIANTFGSAAILIVFLLGGFVIPKADIKPWWVWGFWVSPLSYGQRAIAVNEFTATRWMTPSAISDTSIGFNLLKIRSFPTNDNWYWVGIAVLIGYAVLFNNVVTLALAYLNPLRKARAVVLDDPNEETKYALMSDSNQGKSEKKGMILPFQPLTMTFHNVNYYVDMPKEMRSQGVPETRLQLLSNVSGVFSPGVLTALVGSSGAGKTTLMDVLAGRKTGGYIEGDIRISGHPKEQRTFARISGYVEQNDIHSPQVTVEESLWFSASLRLPKEISKEKKKEFVEEVMRLVELDTLRYALVGLPGTTGLSTEQRKRLTIAVELVANPSIIFMDEPTSGLDARAAAIVMRTVRNTVDTGRTVVCTIHQPSIDIFEAFDELLLMKRGGQVIYGGKLGKHSQVLVDYFQGINGVPAISSGYNPATWMLEVTTPALEEKYNMDFADLYKNSDQFRGVETNIKQLSVPPEEPRLLEKSRVQSREIGLHNDCCAYTRHSLLGHWFQEDFLSGFNHCNGGSLLGLSISWS
ncbi:PREDICTED: ABC transporter G family member 31 [Camelina sativa]|uniref:ABC transporter G family member 31 n=1 Tax=Camelina sativa TaxID=90675 RepID=A0ABM1RP83_CAMSA|nr:PREDICTED: ABC transporter G family member 31 [Camelina sativa]